MGLEVRVLWAFETENPWWEQGEPELLPGGITQGVPIQEGSEPPASEQALPEPGKEGCELLRFTKGPHSGPPCRHTDVSNLIDHGPDYRGLWVHTH